MRNCIDYYISFSISITLNTFIAFGDQHEYLIPLKDSFSKLNENDVSSIEDYKRLEEEIEKSEIKYCQKEQNTLVYYYYYYLYNSKRLTDLQTDAKYSDIMTESCNLASILPKSQNRLLQCITICNNKECPLDELREAITYIQLTINKLEMRKRAKEIKGKLVGFLYDRILLLLFIEMIC